MDAQRIEAIDIAQQIAGRELHWTYSDANRTGDHIWWVSDLSKFSEHYPLWRLEYDVSRILEEIHSAMESRWRASTSLESHARTSR